MESDPPPTYSQTHLLWLSPSTRCFVLRRSNRLRVGWDENADADTIAKLRRNLSLIDRAALLQDAHLAPAWIADIFHQLAKGDPR